MAERSREAGEQRVPQTPDEERLAAIWEEVLELAPGRVTVDDNFFALGGDSLRASQLVARWREVTGVELELEDLFSAPTLAELAARLSAISAIPTIPATPATPATTEPDEADVSRPLVRVDRGGSAPLSSAQRRLWFLDQMEPGNPAYNLGLSVTLRGDLLPAALGSALAEVVGRHEALRTVFRGVDRAPVQQVADGVPFALPLIDLRGLPQRAAAVTAARLEREGARLPFDLAAGPLLCARLLWLGAGEHSLQLAIHHIVSDGWSLGVLLHELMALYAAAAAEPPRPSPLAPLAVQYGDFTVWQEERLAEPALAARLAAAGRRLSGCPRVLALPADRPRPPVQGYAGAHAVHALPAAIVAGLKALAAKSGASLFMALLAGFEALLYRSTAESDLLVGTAVANRPHRHLEGLIGLFVNTLALRGDLSGDPSFVELLDRARQDSLAALAGREVPFERLVDLLQPQRDLSHPPLVQVMLVLHNAPLAVAPPPGLLLHARETDNGTARFDLALSLVAGGDGLAAVFKYSRDLFDAPTIERLAGHFAALLAGVVADPTRRLSALPLLAAPEHHQVAVEWNDTALCRDGENRCLTRRIEEQVDRAPDGVALVFEGGQLSYRELDRRADLLAHRLRRLDVGPEVVVAVAAERSLELMVGLLAVLKAGGAYLPLDPSYPSERLELMLSDARVRLLLLQERLRGGLPTAGLRTVSLDAPAPEAATGSPAGPAEAAAGALPDNLAYVIYTSGSTGRPKGTAISHRAIVNRLLWMQETYGLASGEAVLQKTPVSFDVSVWELFWPLLVGGRLVLARPGGQQDTAYLAALIAREQVTTLHFVPSMLHAALEEPRLAQATSLRRVMASGEALPRELGERFFARLGGAGVELHNLYGPTEAAVDVTFWPLDRELDRRRGVPIGRPISNLRIHLLDPDGYATPVGVPGHLHIGGVGLARGYVGRPDLTAARFVPDPGKDPGGRLYATGDLARLRPDGAIEFLGRFDHQVKVRGFRIELGEIEAGLDAHPAVRGSVVVAVRAGDAGNAGDIGNAGGGYRLVAYVVGEAAGARPASAELRSFLSARLPDPMLPARFVFLDRFPLSPSGKVDRKALPPPEEVAESPAAAGVAPRTVVEERLAALWREHLGVSKVSVDDSFFTLGGDSIQAALLVNRLQRELGAVVYVMALFDHPTVAQLAAHLSTAYRGALVTAGWLAAPTGVTDEESAAACDESADAADMAALARHLAARFSPAEADAAPPPPGLRRAIFILSPFRSGSTLLRVMLAGHPGLFAPPELELLGFTTLGERRRAFTGRDGFAREGLLRAIMELRGLDAAAAEAPVAAAEDRDEPTPVFYRRLAEWAGDRILVDKTPRYSLDPVTLSRAERGFAEPLYVHLVRHPAATVQSYLEARMDEVYRFPLPPRRQAELVWRRSHENILSFLAGVPTERQIRLSFEDLVRSPGEAMAALCRFFALPFHPATLSPYAGQRMTDGLRGGVGRMMGDPKFHHHRQIDAAAADRWQDAPAGIRLGAATWRLAGRLGYRPPVPAAPLATPSDIAAGGRVMAPIRRLAPRHEWPLAYAQERLWFISRLEQNDSFYAMPGALRLRGSLQWPILAASLAEIVRRHTSLSTRFVVADGRPMQVVAAEWRPALPLVDLAGLRASVAAAESGRFLAATQQEPPFDLAAGPLLRATLVRVADGDFLLLVTLHHLIADGWSIGLLLAELTAIYRALARGVPSPLPALPVQYTDFAVWQREQLSGERLAELLGYWQQQLADVAALDLPTDRPPVPGQTFRAATRAVVVSRSLAAALQTLAAGERASLFMVLLAVYQGLLARHSGQDDIAVGIPIAGRNRAELEPLIGCFVNTLVVRTRLGARPSLRQLLERVRAVTLAAYEHQDLPFALLIEAVRPQRRQLAMPLVATLFTLQNQPGPLAELPGFELALVPRGEGGRTQFALVLNLREVAGAAGELAGTLAYNCALLDGTTGSRWRDHWLNLLAAAVAEPDRPIDELALLGAGERQQVLVEWGDGREIVRTGSQPAPIGVWGEVPASGTAGSVRRARRRFDGTLETASTKGESEPSPTLREAALQQPADGQAQVRSELADRRLGLSPVKRDLLAQRLSGRLAAAGTGGAGARPRPPAKIDLPETPLDLAAEAVLDPTIGGSTISPGGGGPQRAAAPGETPVLLTGATGFLGGHLLMELLRCSPTDVYCLVRGDGVAQATARLRASLERYGLWDDALARRLSIVNGDLSRPLLGLTDARFAALAGEVGAIHHNGAWVNASYPYSALRASNVLGTQEVLRLAFEGPIKPVHFVSTISVFFAPEYRELAIVPEDDGLDLVTLGTSGGYAQSKWVAERMIAMARQRGLPASVYRFGRATWHSQTGVWNPNDALRHVLETCLLLGSVPDADANLDLVPVDYLAAAIVTLSRQERSAGKAFHLLSPQEISWRELIGWARSLDHAFDVVPFEEWLARAKSDASTVSLPHLLRLGGLAFTAAAAAADSRPRRFGALVYDTRNTVAGLAGTGIVCPRFNPELLRTFLARHAFAGTRPARVGA